LGNNSDFGTVLVNFAIPFYNGIFSLKIINMKNSFFAIAVVLTSVLSMPVFSQTKDEPVSLGLPGDNLDLYAVMEIFQKSKTIEDFEKSLNADKESVNNLDLNNDKKVDFIKVITDKDGDSFSFVLQVAVSKTENQDVAVILVSKDESGKTSIQIVGDEDLYGKNYVVEPKGNGGSNSTVNPGYSGQETMNLPSSSTTTTIVVQSPPIVQYVYSPAYMSYYPPYYYGYYPPYFHPWVPIMYGVYWSNHFYCHGGYYGGYHGSVNINVNNSHHYNNYNNNSRNRSNTVNNYNRNGNYINNGNRNTSNLNNNRATTRPTNSNGNRATTRPISPSTRPTRPTSPTTRPTSPTGRPTSPSTRQSGSSTRQMNSPSTNRSSTSSFSNGGGRSGAAMRGGRR
jgi:hypothetical protein